MYNGEPHRVSAKPWGIRDLLNAQANETAACTLNFEILSTCFYHLHHINMIPHYVGKQLRNY